MIKVLSIVGSRASALLSAFSMRLQHKTRHTFALLHFFGLYDPYVLMKESYTNEQMRQYTGVSLSVVHTP